MDDAPRSGLETQAAVVRMALRGEAVALAQVRQNGLSWNWALIRHRVLRDSSTWRIPPDATELLDRWQRGEFGPEQPVADARAGDDWPDPIPLGDPPPPPIPLDGLPAVLRRHVESVAASTQTPTDAAALLALAAVSICVHGRAVVRVQPGWTEYLGIYVVLVLDSGTRKSPVWAGMMGPIEAWEADERQRMAPETARALDHREILETRYATLKKSAARGKASLDEVEAARIALAQHEVPRARRLIASDITPEALGSRMAEHNGCMAVCAPEGDPLRIAAGRYGQAPNLDVLKRAWSCERVLVDRTSRPDEVIQRPSLVLAIAMQPSVLETIEHASTLRGEGLYGRILWARPEDGVGSRLTGASVPALDQEAAGEYDRLLRALLALQPRGQVDGVLDPQILRMDDDADEVRYQLEAKVERELAPGGYLHDLRDWGGKMTGQAIRIAALLRTVAVVHEGHNPWHYPITGDSMRAGAAIAWALAAHARTVLSAESRDELGRFVLERVARIPEAERTVREAWYRVRNRSELRNIGDLNEVLVRLEGHHLIRIVPERSNGGRPRSPRIQVRPGWEDFCDVGAAQKSTEVSLNGTSVTSVPGFGG